MIKIRLICTLLLGASMLACGGGSGVGPEAIRKQENKLRDRLPIDWVNYNSGDYQGAIDFFVKTLEQADTFEGSEAIINEIKSEAHNGIGWAFFRQQDLDAASSSFQQATKLNRRNEDAWVGYAGVALARGLYNDVVQYAIQALSINSDYSSTNRIDDSNRQLGHDGFETRHVRLLLAEAYFQLGRYSAVDRPDPSNAAAQMRLAQGAFIFRDPGQLLQEISKLALELQQESNNGF
ncbi:MAG: tetratricopeptide (TPR) repeat protein [Candidatus Latescibacterota bacterium]|jgi:tetratricopeptide (TPR) repeat protein